MSLGLFIFIFLVGILGTTGIIVAGCAHKYVWTFKPCVWCKSRLLDGNGRHICRFLKQYEKELREIDAFLEYDCLEESKASKSCK